MSLSEISLIQETLNDSVVNNVIQRALSVRSNRSNGSDGSTRKKPISRQVSKQSVHSKTVTTVPGRANLIGVEESATGAVTWLVYKKYIQSIGCWIDLGMVVGYQDEQGLNDVQILTAVFNALAYVSDKSGLRMGREM